MLLRNYSLTLFVKFYYNLFSFILYMYNIDKLLERQNLVFCMPLTCLLQPV